MTGAPGFQHQRHGLDLISGALIDPCRQAALQARRLAFLHEGSVSDDPTADPCARYSARLNLPARTAGPAGRLALALAGLVMARPSSALSTRSDRADRLFLNEPWSDALEHLFRWQAMALIDPGLQVDSIASVACTEPAFRFAVDGGLAGRRLPSAVAANN